MQLCTKPYSLALSKRFTARYHLTKHSAVTRWNANAAFRRTELDASKHYTPVATMEVVPEHSVQHVHANEFIYVYQFRYAYRLFLVTNCILLVVADGLK